MMGPDFVPGIHLYINLVLQYDLAVSQDYSKSCGILVMRYCQRRTFAFCSTDTEGVYGGCADLFLQFSNGDRACRHFCCGRGNLLIFGNAIQGRSGISLMVERFVKVHQLHHNFSFVEAAP